MIKIKQKLFNTSASTNLWQRLVNSTLDTPTRQLAIACIGGYQRYLSPYKGFAYAHRRLHGGDSCSQYIKTLLTQQGVIATLKASPERFQACRDAHQTLKSRYQCLSRQATISTNDQKRRSSDNSCTDSIDCSSICFDISCEGLDCIPELDCGGADCGSGFDCSGVDCGSCAW